MEKPEHQRNMSPVNREDDLVLVTGASGYIALHLVKLLLKECYRVRGTVRSFRNQKKIRNILSACPQAPDYLELFEADLADDKGWVDAVKGCTYVIHVASPLPLTLPEKEEDIIKPAVEGTRRVLRACAESGTIRRVVLTSSVAAIHGESTGNEGVIYNEDDWSDVDSKFLDAYSKSKTFAEKMAWEFVSKLPESQRFELVSLNPGLVLGPVLGNEIPTSVNMVYSMMSSTLMPLIPNVNFPVCDVRDVALAHLRAMITPEASNCRHIIGSANLWMIEMAKILSDEFGSQGFKISLWRAPNLLIRLYSLFDKATSSFISPFLDKVYKFDNKRMIKVLNVKPRCLKRTLIDTSYSLMDKGLIHCPNQASWIENLTNGL